MKIAVLLRGQARFAELGAQVFNKYVRDRFPQHEFKVYIATWKSMSLTMSTEQTDPNAVCYGREFHQEILSEEEVAKTIMSWSPARFNIYKEQVLANLVRNIMLKNQGDSEYIKWIEKTLTENKKRDGLQLLRPATPLNIFAENLNEAYGRILSDQPLILSDGAQALKRQAINIQYILGQVFSAGKAHDVLQKHIKVDGWEPDLIWVTRPDWYGWLEHENYFSDMYNFLKRQPDPTIGVDYVSIVRGRPHITDYNFYMLPDTAMAALDNIDENIFELLTDDKELSSMLIGSGTSLQHLLWVLVFRKFALKNMPNTQHSSPRPNNIIRPIPNITEKTSALLAAETSKENMIAYDKEMTSYNYPNANTPATPELIDEVYLKLMTN